MSALTIIANAAVSISILTSILGLTMVKAPGSSHKPGYVLASVSIVIMPVSAAYLFFTGGFPRSV